MDKPQVLILGHGGMYIFKMIGFLTAIDDKGMLKDVEAICGVSTGALIGLLLICGYKPREIVEQLILFKELEENGYYEMDNYNNNVLPTRNIRNKLEKIVSDKIGFVPTLRGLDTITSIKFYVTTIEDNEPIIISSKTHPNILCIDVVIMSMNKISKNSHIEYNGKKYQDGNLANPYPILYFDNNLNYILGLYTKVNNHFDILNISIEQRIKEIILSSSDKCINVCIENDYIKDINVEYNAKILLEGFNIGNKFYNNLNL